MAVAVTNKALHTHTRTSDPLYRESLGLLVKWSLGCHSHLLWRQELQKRAVNVIIVPSNRAVDQLIILSHKSIYNLLLRLVNLLLSGHRRLHVRGFLSCLQEVTRNIILLNDQSKLLVEYLLLHSLFFGLFGLYILSFK